MGLIAWYPLNGDLNNQGIGDMDLTVSSTPTYIDGKIGKALSGGTAYWTATQTANILNNQHLSICFWIYPIEGGDNIYKTLFGTFDMVANNNRKFMIMQYPTVEDLHLSWMNDTANETFFATQEVGVFPFGKWTHCAVTYENPEIKIYINGILHKTFSGVSNSSSFAYQTNVITDSRNRYINDYRFYDHCLSAKEVKEISKGLVLHYPMNQIDGVIGGRNLLKNSFISSIWECAYGTNPASSVELHTFTTPENVGGQEIKQCHKVSYVSGATGDMRYTESMILASSGEEANGKQYTLSAWVKAETDCNISIILTRNDDSDTTSKVHSLTANTWTRINVSKTFNTSSTGTTTQRIRFTFGGITTNYYICMMKLEEGLVMTPWTPAPEDNEIYNDTTVYDVSGYSNNGTVTESSMPSWSNDTPIGKGSYGFDGNTKYIEIPSLYIPSSFTFSAWVNYNNENKDYGRLFSFQTTQAWNDSTNNTIAISHSAQSFGLYISTNGSHLDNYHWKDITSGSWNHIAFTVNDTTIHYYQNGVKIATAILPVNFTERICTYAWIGTTNYISKYNGKISDFRIYSTALSDSDIEELYRTRFNLTDSGVLFCSELVEEDVSNVSLHETGIISVNNSYESSAMNLKVASTNDYITYIPTTGTNSCSGSFVVDMSNCSEGDKLRVRLRVKWDGFDTSNTAGTLNMWWQGANWNVENNTWEWAGTNVVSSALSSQSLKSLVLSATSGETVLEYTGTVTSNFPNTHSKSQLMIRTDYSNGTASITFGELEVIPEKYVTDFTTTMRIGEDYISTNEIIEN